MAFNALCQYSTDKFSTAIGVVYLPTYYVEPDNRTFAVAPRGSRSVTDYLDYEGLEKEYTPSGFTYNAENPYLVTYIDIDNMEILKSYEIEEFEEVREHGEIHRYPIYYPAIDYLLPITVTVQSPLGSSSYQNREDNYEKKWIVYSWRGAKHYHHPRDAHDYIRDNKDNIKEDCINTHVFEFYAQVRPNIDKMYCYSVTSDLIPCWLLDSKKSEFYPKYKSTRDNIKSILQSYKHNTDPATIITKLKPHLKVILEEAEAMDPADKKQRSAKMDLYAALGYLYFSVEIFDVARDYAQKVGEIDEKNGRRLLKRIEDYENALRYHHLDTKHF